MSYHSHTLKVDIKCRETPILLHKITCPLPTPFQPPQASILDFLQDKHWETCKGLYYLMPAIVAQYLDPDTLRTLEACFNAKRDFIASEETQLFLELVYCVAKVKHISNLWRSIRSYIPDIVQISTQLLSGYASNILACLICDLHTNCEDLTTEEHESLQNVMAFYFGTRYCTFKIIRILAEIYPEKQHVDKFVKQFNETSAVKESLQKTSNAHLNDTVQLIGVISWRLFKLSQQELVDMCDEVKLFFRNSALHLKRSNMLMQGLGNMWKQLECHPLADNIMQQFLVSVVDVWPECLLTLDPLPVIRYFKALLKRNLKYVSMMLLTFLDRECLLGFVWFVIHSLMIDLEPSELITFCEFLHSSNIINLIQHFVQTRGVLEEDRKVVDTVIEVVAQHCSSFQM